MSSSNTVRMVAASFAAGASAMVMVGLVAPIAMQGGLAMRDAMAATIEQEAPAVQPLDVVAVQAQLDEARRAVATSHSVNDGAMARLDQLAGRR